MTTGKNWVTAGLVFLGVRDIDIVKISNRVCSTFELLDQVVTGVRVLSDDSSLVTSEHFQIWISTQEDRPTASLESPATLFLSVRIAPSDAAPSDDMPAMDSVLAHVLKSLHWDLSADYVQWIEEDAVLSSADFVTATAQPYTPPLAKPVYSQADVQARFHDFPAIDETNEILQSRISQRAVLDVEGEFQGSLRSVFLKDPNKIGQPPEPPEDVREKTAPLRLSVWMLSFTIALFSLPVGAALIVFNLLRGENLRLSSQTAALTGTFITLQVYGTTAQAMSTIQNIIG